jgi:hypothetical protein
MPFGETVTHPQPRPPAPPPTRLVCTYADLRTAAKNGSYPARCMLANLVLSIIPNLRTQPNHQAQLFPGRPP